MPNNHLSTKEELSQMVDSLLMNYDGSCCDETDEEVPYTTIFNIKPTSFVFIMNEIKSYLNEDIKNDTV